MFTHPHRKLAADVLSDLPVSDTPEYHELVAAMESLARSPSELTRYERAMHALGQYSDAQDREAILPAAERAKHLANMAAVPPRVDRHHPGVHAEAVAAARASGHDLASADAAFTQAHRR
jgi:hypothetical protein